MTKLRAQAINMLEEIPEEALAYIITVMERTKNPPSGKHDKPSETEPPTSDLVSEPPPIDDDDPEKAHIYETLRKFIYGDGKEMTPKQRAFAELEKCRKEMNARYGKVLGPDFDWKREVMEAIDEKYGRVD